MAIFYVREQKGSSMPIPVPREPAVYVHKVDTGSGAVTIGPFLKDTGMITIWPEDSTSTSDLRYDIGPESGDLDVSALATGATAGEIYASVLPYSMEVEPGDYIKINHI